jgi:hypothetical protein
VRRLFLFLENHFSPVQSALIRAVLCPARDRCRVATIIARRNAMEHAQQALDARAKTAMFDSSMLTLGMQIGRTIGWKRLVPVAAVAILAVAVAKEWAGRGKTEDEE